MSAYNFGVQQAKTQAQADAQAQAQTTSSGASTWFRRHPLATFLVLAYGITWLSLIGAVVAIQFDLLPSDSAALDAVNNLATFGPAIAALVVTALAGGRRGVGQLLRRIVQWRVGVQWYLFALLGLPLVVLLAASALYGSGLFGTLIERWPIFTAFLPAVATTTLITGMGEEPGWRGFGLPRLQAKYGPLLGTLILSIIWVPWHLPNILLQPGGLQTFPLWVVATVVYGFVLAWVYNGTNGSILLVALAHGAGNKTSGLISNLLYINDPSALSVPQVRVEFMNQYSLIFAASLGLIVLAVIVFTKGRLGYKREQVAQQVEAAQPLPSPVARP